MAAQENLALRTALRASLDSSKGGDQLSGLREQILANAVHVFPSVVKEHSPMGSAGGLLPPSRIFDVVISRPPSTRDETPCFQAILTYGNPQAKRTAVIAAPAANVEGALVNMVEATGRIIAQTMGTVTEELKEVSLETYGGRYDWDLITKSRELSSKKRGK